MLGRLIGDRGPRRSHRGAPAVLFDRQVFDYMLSELSRNPAVEEGGKYVGYFLKRPDRTLDDLGIGSHSAILLVDFLPSGPEAVRSAVELLPDGRFQEALFRRLERLDSTIEHVGTWHSHHCNGLARLSQGDVEGYFRTVNKPAYNLDFFVASLVKRVPDAADDAHWIDHFLFIRGDSSYYVITDQVRLVEWPSKFGGLTGHSMAMPSEAATVSGSYDLRPTEPAPVTPWYESEIGRKVLAQDKPFFDEAFAGQVTASRRGHRITIVGHRHPFSVAAAYPGDASDAQLSVSLERNGDTVMRLEVSVANRHLAYVAALAALSELSKSTF